MPWASLRVFELSPFLSIEASFTLVVYASGMMVGLYVFKSLWIGMSKDWIAGAVIVLTAIFTIVLTALLPPLQSTSSYIGAMVFGALAIGILCEKITETVESAMEDTH